jgi:hypothetical protein
MNQIHPRYQRTLDDLFLHVFVRIDDFLQPYESHLPRQAHQKASISEILTIAIVGEILAQPFESVWYWLVKQNHQDLFPSLPHPSRYHRILRNSEQLIAQLALSVNHEQVGVELIDSKPLPVAKGKRASWAKLPEAMKGFSTMGMVFGFKLHNVVGKYGFRRHSRACRPNSEDELIFPATAREHSRRAEQNQQYQCKSSHSIPPWKLSTGRHSSSRSGLGQ